MMRRPVSLAASLRARCLLSVALVLAALGAACGGAEPVQPTRAPIRQARAPTTTAVPDATPTATVPVSQAAPAPTAIASATPPSTTVSAVAPTPAPQPTIRARNLAVNLTIRAANLAFDQSVVHVPTGAVVTATLRNDDVGVQHNLTFSLPGLGHGETCTGPCTATQTFTPVTAGSYFFLCTLHDMTGTLVVDP